MSSAATEIPESSTCSQTESVKHSGYELVIRPKTGWRFIDFKELYEYQDLFRFLVWRNIKVQYAQSSLGVGWAIIQPVMSMIVFTVIFGGLAGVESDGAPYAVFSFVAVVPWTYFSNAVTQGSNSLIGSANMISKVYFPRMILPLAAVCSKLVDFVVAMVILSGFLAWYRIMPTPGVLLLPLLIAIMVFAAAGLGMWLTALSIQYRDVKFALTFFVQILMYCTPVVYPVSLIPKTYVWNGWVLYPQITYAANPMVGVIEGFRSALLGTTPMPWKLIAVGATSATLLLVGGAMYFRRKDRLFADVA